jgi:hypothetical protein
MWPAVCALRGGAHPKLRRARLSSDDAQCQPLSVSNHSGTGDHYLFAVQNRMEHGGTVAVGLGPIASVHERTLGADAG